MRKKGVAWKTQGRKETGADSDADAGDCGTIGHVRMCVSKYTSELCVDIGLKSLASIRRVLRQILVRSSSAYRIPSGIC